jgi:hypothetical protein
MVAEHAIDIDSLKTESVHREETIEMCGEYHAGRHRGPDLYKYLLDRENSQ